MGVGVVAGGEGATGNEVIQIWPYSRACHDRVVALVFFQNHHDVMTDRWQHYVDDGLAGLALILNAGGGNGDGSDSFRRGKKPGRADGAGGSGPVNSLTEA